MDGYSLNEERKRPKNTYIQHAGVSCIYPKIVDSSN